MNWQTTKLCPTLKVHRDVNLVPVHLKRSDLPGRDDTKANAEQFRFTHPPKLLPINNSKSTGYPLNLARSQKRQLLIAIQNTALDLKEQFDDERDDRQEIVKITQPCRFDLSVLLEATVDLDGALTESS